uniref:Uncharacterized protein n=1 Tax=Chlamydomonas leiostraca TaxID=1034604 RepID=A0A7S0RER9_9CHLO|mmetsp:Transcript_20837/g.52990  ORF Transcript_20837/g.52990 Transcript_20837/m.52990 type:complete len:416 (+) Transcript_20837:222-1469(+)
MEAEFDEVKQDIKEVKDEIKKLAVGDSERVALQARLAALEGRRTALEGRLTALQEKEVLLLKQAQAATATQPPATQPGATSGQAGRAATSVCEIADSDMPGGAGSAGGVGLGGAADVAKFHEMYDMLKRLCLRENKTVSISKAPVPVVKSVYEALGFHTIEDVQAWGDNKGAYTFTTFSWNGRSEEQAAPDLCDHMRQELDKLGRAWKGFRLMDIRGRRSLLNYHAGNNSLRGTADAAVIPTGVNNEAAGSQLRAVIDWKTTQALEDHGAVVRQAVLELCGALVHSHHPVMVVVTNCVDKMLLATAEERAICICHNLSDGGQLTGISEGMRMFAHYLSGCKTEADFHGGSRSNLLSHLPGASRWQLQMSALRRVQRIVSHGAGNPIAEQLEVVSSLPLGERMTAAMDLLTSWVRD